MNIPDEAVEAAAKARGCVWTPAKAKHPDCAECREQARLILEAAAPRIIVAALREAAEAWGEAASWSDSRPSAEQVQRWLNSRANMYTQT